MAKNFENLNKGTKSLGGFSQLISGVKNEKPKENVQTKDINTKNVPVAVHRFLKNKATEDETTIAKLIIEAIVGHYKLEDLIK